MGIEHADDLRGMLPDEILAALDAERQRADAAEQERDALREAMLDAVDCLSRVLHAGQPFSFSRRDEVMLAVESLERAMLEHREAT